MDRLKQALSGRDVRCAVTHCTDSVFQATADVLKTAREFVATVPGLRPAAVLDPTLFVKPWEFAAQVAAQDWACVRFFPEVHRWPMGSYRPFELCLEALAPSGIPVSVAVTEPGQVTALARLEQSRSMPIILAHLGDDCVSEVAAVVPKMEQWCLSTDGLSHVGLLEELVDAIGQNRIVFGSTAPRGSIEGALRYVQTSSLSDDAKEAILCGNAERLFGGRLATH